MLITFLMYATWMFTFMHIFEAVYAAKNKRVAKFVLFENVLDFWIMLMGMIYIAIVYKVYRWDTFVSQPSKETLALKYFDSWTEFTYYIDDQYFLLVIDFTYILKGFVQLRLLPVMGPVYSILKMLMKELMIFVVFFGLVQFLFAIVGNLIFHDLPSYATLTESMLTIFKASSGIFDNKELSKAE